MRIFSPKFFTKLLDNPPGLINRRTIFSFSPSPPYFLALFNLYQISRRAIIKKDVFLLQNGSINSSSELFTIQFSFHSFLILIQSFNHWPSLPLIIHAFFHQLPFIDQPILGHFLSAFPRQNGKYVSIGFGLPSLPYASSHQFSFRRRPSPSTKPPKLFHFPPSPCSPPIFSSSNLQIDSYIFRPILLAVFPFACGGESIESQKEINSVSHHPSKISPPRGLNSSPLLIVHKTIDQFNRDPPFHFGPFQITAHHLLSNWGPNLGMRRLSVFVLFCSTGFPIPFQFHFIDIISFLPFFHPIEENFG